MKKKMTIFICLLLCLTMMFSMTACKGNPFDNTEDGLDEVEGKGTITVGVLAEEMSLARKFKSEFEKTNKKINIKLKVFSADYAGAMDTYNKDPKSTPDVIWTPGDQHSPFSAQGMLLDLTPYYAKSEETALTNYYDKMIETTHFSNVDKGIWFAPRDYNKPITYINKAIFEAAGVAIPTQEEWNYAKFLEVCGQLRTAMDTNKDPAKTAVGLTKKSYPVDAELGWNAVYHSIIESFGGKLIDDTKTGAEAIAINNSANLEAYRKLYNDLVKSKYSYSPQSGAAGTTFLKKGSAMWFSVRPKLPSIKTANLDVDFLPLPFEKIGVGCSGYAISSESAKREQVVDGKTVKNSDLAWEFIKWIITTPGQEVFGAFGSGVPVLKTLQNGGAWTKFGGENLNHTAFTSYQERDIGLNKIYQFKPENHYTLFTTMNSLLISVTKESNWSTDAIMQAELNRLKAIMDAKAK